MQGGAGSRRDWCSKPSPQAPSVRGRVAALQRRAKILEDGGRARYLFKLRRRRVIHGAEKDQGEEQKSQTGGRR